MAGSRRRYYSDKSDAPMVDQPDLIDQESLVESKHHHRYSSSSRQRYFRTLLLVLVLVVTLFTGKTWYSSWQSPTFGQDQVKEDPDSHDVNDHVFQRIEDASSSTTNPKIFSSDTQGFECDTEADGYICDPTVSHIWGQYSPWFRVPSDIGPEVPTGCEVVLVQILSRHGARFPTDGHQDPYNETITRIQSRVPKSAFKGPYAFLADYRYELGVDNLTRFGEQELENSGALFFEQYSSLASISEPFIRASGSARVVQSAKNFTDGFCNAKTKSSPSAACSQDILVLPEGAGMNDTLNHGNCPAFEQSNNGDEAQDKFKRTFLPQIQSRLNHDLVHAKLDIGDALHLMELCPFETVASPTGQPSKFCPLFSEAEWEAYDYYQTLGKFYGFGAGNPLGPTQGVGFTNELLARLTQTPVKDHTSVNHTLDDNEATFPLNRTIYADFSHDNPMMSIFSAMGLYNETPKHLSKSHIMSKEELKGYSAATFVPFASRVVFEKLSCSSSSGSGISARQTDSNKQQEKIRVILNGRVLPLSICGADSSGLCTLDDFVKAQAFSIQGGKWDEC